MGLREVCGLCMRGMRERGHCECRVRVVHSSWRVEGDAQGILQVSAASKWPKLYAVVAMCGQCMCVAEREPFASGDMYA